MVLSSLRVTATKSFVTAPKSFVLRIFLCGASLLWIYVLGIADRRGKPNFAKKNVENTPEQVISAVVTPETNELYNKNLLKNLKARIFRPPRKFDRHYRRLDRPLDTYFSQCGQDQFLDHLIGRFLPFPRKFYSPARYARIREERMNNTINMELENPEDERLVYHGQQTSATDVNSADYRPFIIEAGAATGEHLSNSLYFEKTRKWDCLLVEPTPKFLFQSVLPKRRDCHVIFGAIAIESQDSMKKKAIEKLIEADMKVSVVHKGALRDLTDTTELTKIDKKTISKLDKELLSQLRRNATFIEDTFSELHIESVGTTAVIAEKEEDTEGMRQQLFGPTGHIHQPVDMFRHDHEKGISGVGVALTAEQKRKMKEDIAAEKGISVADLHKDEEIKELNPADFANKKIIEPKRERGATAFLEKTPRGIVLVSPQEQMPKKPIVRAFPFNLMMQALNRTIVDILSLDTETTELAILKTVDFNKIEIGAIVLESNHFNKEQQSELYGILKDNHFLEVNPTSYYSGTKFSSLQSLGLRGWVAENRGKSKAQNLAQDNKIRQQIDQLHYDWKSKTKSPEEILMDLSEIDISEYKELKMREILDAYTQDVPTSEIHLMEMQNKRPGEANEMFMPSQGRHYLPISFYKSQKRHADIDMFNGYLKEEFFSSNRPSAKPSESSFDDRSGMSYVDPNLWEATMKQVTTSGDWTSNNEVTDYESPEHLVSNAIFSFSPDPSIQVREGTLARQLLWKESKWRQESKPNSEFKSVFDTLMNRPSIVRSLDSVPERLREDPSGQRVVKQVGNIASPTSTFEVPLYEAVSRKRVLEQVRGKVHMLEEIEQAALRELGFNTSATDIATSTKSLKENPMSSNIPSYLPQRRSYYNQLEHSTDRSAVEYLMYKQVYGNVGFRHRTWCRYDTFWVNRKYMEKRKIPLYPYLLKNSSHSFCHSYQAIVDPNPWERQLMLQHDHDFLIAVEQEKIRYSEDYAKKFLLKYELRRRDLEREKSIVTRSGELKEKLAETMVKAEKAKVEKEKALSKGGLNETEGEQVGIWVDSLHTFKRSNYHLDHQNLRRDIQAASHREVINTITPDMIVDSRVYQNIEGDYNALLREFNPFLYNGTRNMHLDSGESLQRLTQPGLDIFNLLKASPGGSYGTTTNFISDYEHHKDGSKDKSVSVWRRYAYSRSMDFVNEFLLQRKVLQDAMDGSSRSSSSSSGSPTQANKDFSGSTELVKRESRRADTLFRRMMGYMAVMSLEIMNLDAILRYPATTSTKGEKDRLKVGYTILQKAGVPLSIVRPDRIDSDTSLETVREYISAIDEENSVADSTLPRLLLASPEMDKFKEPEAKDKFLHEVKDKYNKLHRLGKDFHGNLNARDLEGLSKKEELSLVEKSRKFHSYDDLGRKARTIPMYHLKNSGVICTDIEDNEFVSQYVVYQEPKTMPSAEDVLELELRLAEQGYYASLRFSNYIDFRSRHSQEYIRRLKTGLRLIRAWKNKAKERVLESTIPMDSPLAISRNYTDVGLITEYENADDFASRFDQEKFLLGRASTNVLMTLSEKKILEIRKKTGNNKIMRAPISGSNHFLSDTDSETRLREVNKVQYVTESNKDGKEDGRKRILGEKYELLTDEDLMQQFPSVNAYIRSLSPMPRHTTGNHTATSAVWERHCGTALFTSTFFDRRPTDIDFIRMVFFNENYFNDLGAEIINNITEASYGGWGNIVWKNDKKIAAENEQRVTVNLPPYLYPLMPGKTVRIDRQGLFLWAGTSNTRIRWAEDKNAIRFPIHAHNHGYWDETDDQKDVELSKKAANSSDQFKQDHLSRAISDAPSVNADRFYENTVIYRNTIHWPRVRCAWVDTDVMMRKDL